ncbi:PP2C family protein-serine/threonine phosphatase [Phycicoccus flavus]|uniref:PP2C family protein-serine/threonine phosphatase n=1 Tax=Phycicoccus flavus TaxID=2502783 RepID=UPI000FEB8253|nr:protein phosphatase 2C domain-containing protein [Phycicoccus flavus]NHA70324.1 serine/threonine-protein phosphatase [Phycicoccus flavus]
MSAAPLRVRAAGATDVGVVRDHNEDDHVVGERVFVVADGMGGHAAGEVASRLVVETFAGLDAAAATGPEDVAAAVAEANRRILASAAEHPERAGMGTTATGLVLVADAVPARWVVLNVGDSRVYRLAGDGLRQLTTDHSEVRKLLEAGLIDEDELSTHPLRNVITRSVGLEPAPEPDLWERDAEPGETFVVCSDGLTNELGDDDLERLLRENPDPQDAADALVAAAVQAGGRDNVTVVVVTVDGAGS